MDIEKLKARQLLQNHIHQFFQTRSYLSIDAPTLVVAPGTEVHLNYFATDWQDHRLHNHRLYLRSSPELHLKQALSFGIDRVYHLGKSFRNHGEISAWHHPEFTMLEYYESGISLSDFMALTEEFIRSSAEALGTQAKLKLPAAFTRISMYDAFEQWAGITLIDDDPDLAAKGIAKGYVSLNQGDDFETAYFKILLDLIEPRLAGYPAIFVTDYPPSQAALAKLEKGRAKRFELYIGGVELCNAFDELLSPEENRERLKASNTQRVQNGTYPLPEDQDFLNALRSGLKACCGNALGFDRLLALLLGLKGIGSVIPFRANAPYQASLRSEHLDES
ncbi:MAG: EF-P lysine aminoacylase GenX [Chitinophagaceae bacterium]|nr:EF-P lysine aminoacylase GenX [Oligoflexus sp.]